MEQYTPEQKADIEARVKDFMERYQALTKEMQIEFEAVPQYVEVGPRLFTTRGMLNLVDKKYTPVPSPLANEGGQIVEA